MPRADSTSNLAKSQSESTTGIENYELPRTLVTKIAKSAVPDNTKLQKEVVTSLVKGSTVFINYLAATAHDVAASKQHKSISATDVLKALEVLEFADMVPELQNELNAYREHQKRVKQNGGGIRGKAREAMLGEQPAKGKGKEKLAFLPTTAPQMTGQAVLPTQGYPDDMDTQADAIRMRPDEDEEMVEAYEEGDIPEEEIPEDEPEEEDEELVDTLAPEGADLTHDARRLEDAVGGTPQEDKI
ncbi:histone-fold-containing protein [Heliocybe sulcata]|uniref:DNA polymerase epsilon subunit D n=1 Tax=Heliocybe sulcata TaxID=5364 RepID=A0A5C3N4A6_9AGAM|nr:histone-fold-containing protein [Heliocybe sulcata]